MWQHSELLGDHALLLYSKLWKPCVGWGKQMFTQPSDSMAGSGCREVSRPLGAAGWQVNFSSLAEGKGK